MQKRQQTEDQTYKKLGPSRLCARMETHQPPPPPVSLLYTAATRGGEAVLRGGGMISPGGVILGNRRNLLPIEIRYVIYCCSYLGHNRS
jgi:hypothetical protein